MILFIHETLTSQHFSQRIFGGMPTLRMRSTKRRHPVEYFTNFLLFFISTYLRNCQGGQGKNFASFQVNSGKLGDFSALRGLSAQRRHRQHRLN